MPTFSNGSNWDTAVSTTSRTRTSTSGITNWAYGSDAFSVSGAVEYYFTPSGGAETLVHTSTNISTGNFYPYARAYETGLNASINGTYITDGSVSFTVDWNGGPNGTGFGFTPGTGEYAWDTFSGQFTIDGNYYNINEAGSSQLASPVAFTPTDGDIFRIKFSGGTPPAGSTVFLPPEPAMVRL